MSSKLALSEEIFKSHESAFIEHYEWLMRWSIHLSQDRARAEDLVQQVFTQFAIAQTDLSAVQNIPAYLYTTLRNIHVSEVRLACRSHNQTQSIVDYSGAEAALEATDPYTIFHTQDQLRRICQYACLRKQSSRSGSVLILRYFHGYHLSEVAKVVHGSFAAVRQQLTFARNEARLFLEDPSALKFIQHSADIPSLSANGFCSADKLVAELRQAIFASCQGECLGAANLRSLYGEGLTAAADNSALAHIVSCPVCLDEVNARLGLPLLAERHPADTLGPNNDWRDGTRGPRDSGGSGGAVPSRRRGKPDDTKLDNAFLLRCRRSATELFEHYPRELCVAVNGHVLGSHSVSSPVSRLRLDVTIAEELNFVEVLSEERTRLLVMPIDPAPNGEPVQYRRLRLSENRYLEVTFHYGHPWPMIEVVYEEPEFAHDAPLVATAERSLEPAPSVVQVPFLKSSTVGSRLAGLFGGLASLRSLWLRPSFVTAIVSLVLVGILLTFRLENERVVSPSNLLERARAQESLGLPANVATHRVIELEMRRDGALVRKNRIDVWIDQARGISARRVYDESGQLTTGAWIERQPRDGRSLRRIYRRGSSQTIDTGDQDPSKAIRDAELWQLDPSAVLFTAFLDRPAVARVNETNETYVIDYVAEQGRADGLLKASLTLRKSDLHPLAQTLVITRGPETYDYSFVETLFEHPRLDLVNPAVFQPDAELRSEVRVPVTAKSSVLPSTTSAHTGSTSELELNVVYALDRFRTRFGDQLSVIKTPAGALEIRGVIDSDETRNEIRRELSLFIDDPKAIRMRLSTATELLARTPKAQRVIVKDFSGSDHDIAVYSELSQYFSTHQTTGETEQQRDRLIRDFAAEVVGRSQRAVAHSLELKQLGSRFSVKEFDQFTPSARAKWFSLVRNHAEALRRELLTLDEELQRTLFSISGRAPEAERVDIQLNASLPGEIDRLHQLVLTIDQAVRSSFAVSSTATNDGVKNSRFRKELAASIKLADGIRTAVADR